MPVISTHLSDTRGFTLIEMLVAILVGVIVTGATFSILDISLSQSARIADRVSADQRGRIAMEKILLELHSSCVSIGANPIQTGSEGTKIQFLSQTSSEPSFATMTKHEIYLKEGTLKDASYQSTGGSEATKWTFPVEATRTTTLLTGVSQSAEGATPVFEYFKYVTGNISATPLKTPLSGPDAKTTAKVTVSFTTAPESSNKKGDRLVDLSDSVVLRLTPSAEIGGNEPCE
jgi:prepilin-type N-terminal cleavage/methylation domain-containing protein